MTDEIATVPWRAITPLLGASFPLGLRLNLALARVILPGMSCRAIARDGRVIAALVTRRGRLLDEVVSIVVAAEHRRDGLARRLVAGFVADSAAANRPVVAWVRRSNTASRRFFEALDFRRARVWTLPYAFEEILPWGDHYLHEPFGGSLNRQVTGYRASPGASLIALYLLVQSLNRRANWTTMSS